MSQPPASRETPIATRQAQPTLGGSLPAYVAMADRLTGRFDDLECSDTPAAVYATHGDTRALELSCSGDGARLIALAFKTAKGWIPGQLIEGYHQAGREEEHLGRVAATSLVIRDDGAVLFLWHTEVKYAFRDLDDEERAGTDDEWSDGVPGYHEIHACIIAADGERGGCHTVLLAGDAMEDSAPTWTPILDRIDGRGILILQGSDSSEKRLRFTLETK